MAVNLYGSTGMGAAGTGMPSGGMAAGSGMSPQLLAMMQAMQQQGGGGQGFQPPAGPTGGMGQTPMSSYIGVASPGGGPVGMGGAMPQPQQQAPQQQTGIGQGLGQGVQSATGGMQNTMQLMQMLQKLRGGQTGVPASGAAPTLASTMPQQAASGAFNVPSVPAVAQGQGGGWLSNLFGSMGGGGS